MATTTDAVRLGRPPRVDGAGIATRERLLEASAAACVEHGFDAATVADIAKRANVSAPAIYNHFGGKVELMVAAGQAALARLASPPGSAHLSSKQIVRGYLSDEFAETRRLLVELHLAGARHPDVAALLAAWHIEHAEHWRSQRGRDADAAVKTFFALLLGLCQLESLQAIPGSAADVAAQAEALAAVLFPEEDGP